MPTQPYERQREQELLPEILKALEGIRFGSVEITIHESKVVQIERKEKVRFVNEHSSVTR